MAQKNKAAPKKAVKKKQVAAEKSAEAQPAAARGLTPFEDFDRLFEDFFRRRLQPFRWDWPSWDEMLPAFEGRAPRVDVLERKNEVIVRAELPGVDKKDVDVSMSDNTVTIKATTSREQEEKKEDFYRREISSGTFARTLALPADVDGSKAKATFKDGILELSLPKVAGSKRRQVKVG